MPVPLQLARLAGPTLRLQTDARLIDLSREGHERAFEEIVRRYRAPLVRFAAGIVPPDRAEDVVQEALQRAHATITDTDAELAIRPWLFRVVRNGALNNRRDHRSHEELDPDYDGVPQPPEIAERREELAATIAAINALPRSQRNALIGREVHGMGHEEIAADLGLSAGAARQLIFRARTTLRDALGGLIPAPALRAILEASSAGGAAALGATGGGVLVKAGTAAVVAVLAIGSGVALREGPEHSGAVAEAAPAHPGKGTLQSARDDDGGGRGLTTASGGHNSGSEDGSSGDGRSGEGSGDDGPGGDGGSGHSGPGPGDDGIEDNHEGSGTSGGDDADHSGPGGEETTEPEPDNSGPGGDDGLEEPTDGIEEEHSGDGPDGELSEPLDA